MTSIGDLEKVAQRWHAYWHPRRHAVISGSLLGVGLLGIVVGIVRYGRPEADVALWIAPASWFTLAFIWTCLWDPSRRR